MKEPFVLCPSSAERRLMRERIIKGALNALVLGVQEGRSPSYITSPFPLARGRGMGLSNKT